MYKTVCGNISYFSYRKGIERFNHVASSYSRETFNPCKTGLEHQYGRRHVHQYDVTSCQNALAIFHIIIILICIVPYQGAKVNSRKGLFGIFAAHGVMATSTPGFSRFPICRRRCRRWKTRRPWGRGWGSWRFLVSNGKDHGKVSKRQRLLTTAARATSEFKKPTRQSLARLSPFHFKCLQC